MRIGKPNSKRTPVRLRHKIQKASAAKQRKQKKEAKKNPQWRSRLKKDPGIPNLFPYKAKILAEIEEGKRMKEEEAQRRRDVAKAQRQGVVAEKAVEETGEDNEDDDDDVLLDLEEAADEDEDMEDDESNPMAALLASAQARAQTYSRNDEADREHDDAESDGDSDEWNGIEDGKTKLKAGQSTRKVLPKQALADPIKAVSALLERMQNTQDGMQKLMDYYNIPPLFTTGSDLTSRYLVEVARKRGRLGKGGIPNLHSAALTVLGDLNEERLVLPAMESVDQQSRGAKGKGDVIVVQNMAAPFRIEGLWGDDSAGGGDVAV